MNRRLPHTRTINTWSEYNYLADQGFIPLLDKKAKISIHFRVEIQRELFKIANGRDQANAKFYRWVWDNKPHQCEECLCPLYYFSPTWISHILSRGAHADMAYDPRNVNVLCFTHHNQWEDATKRGPMRIKIKNNNTIELLNDEYQKLK